MRNRRGLLKWMVGVCAWPLLVACNRSVNEARDEGKMDNKKVRRFDVVIYSYLDRPIFDVYLNGIDIGVASEFGGGGAVMTGVPVPLGPQLVTWRLDGVDGFGKPFKDNGNTVAAKNQPVLENVDPELRYLGVHIYPDATVEIIPEVYWPDQTDRGLLLRREWEAKHGRQ